MEIFSDAGKKGWGVACGKETASGLGNTEEASMHINYLELLAAFFGVQIIAKNLNNCQSLQYHRNSVCKSHGWSEISPS